MIKVDGLYYSGRLYFAGSSEVLYAEELHCHSEQEISVRFHCDVDSVRGCMYSGTAVETDDLLYIAGKFRADVNPDGNPVVRIEWRPGFFKYLSDSEGQNYLYVEGYWYEAPSKIQWPFRGLLSGLPWGYQEHSIDW